MLLADANGPIFIPEPTATPSATPAPTREPYPTVEIQPTIPATNGGEVLPPDTGLNWPAILLVLGVLAAFVIWFIRRLGSK